MRESDLYEPVKEFFTDQGYEVYAEVEVPKVGGRVDVVAYAHPAAVAIELKTTLSFQLIEQAMLRKRVFPLVYVAYPKRKTMEFSWLRRFFAEQGLGVIEIDKYGQAVCKLQARYQKPLLRNVKVNWRELLRPEHQEWVPGGHAGGGYVTPYRLTMKGVRHYLSQSRKLDESMDPEPKHKTPDFDVKYPGWRSVADILEFCQTHYATPKSSLAKALQEFEAEWIEWKKENGRLYFRHKELAE